MAAKIRKISIVGEIFFNFSILKSNFVGLNIDDRPSKQNPHAESKA